MRMHEIAKVFGMNVKQFTEITGYSRQGLHQIKNGETKVVPRRWAATMKSLEDYTLAKNQEAVESAGLEFLDRTNCINELRDWGK